MAMTLAERLRRIVRTYNTDLAPIDDEAIEQAASSLETLAALVREYRAEIVSLLEHDATMEYAKYRDPVLRQLAEVDTALQGLE